MKMRLKKLKKLNGSRLLQILKILNLKTIFLMKKLCMMP